MDGRRDDRDDRPARQRRRPGDHRDHAAQDIDEALLDRARRGSCRRDGRCSLHRPGPDLPRPGDVDASTTCCATTRAERPDAVCLDLPDEDATYTYARGARPLPSTSPAALYARGRRAGRPRASSWPPNSSQFVRTWWGTAVGGLVEVPINTNYEGEFLRHQLVRRPGPLRGHRRRAGRAVGRDRRARSRMIEKFWVIDTGGGTRDKAVDAAARERLGGRRLGGARARRHDRAADAAAAGPRRDLLHLRHDRPVQGRRDAASRSCTSSPRSSSRLTRLTPEDTYLTTTPLFHGNATFMAVYPVIVAGGRAVIRSKFSASRWIDHVRDSGVTVTNFVGVMMDFAWKQAPRDNDRGQPAALRLRRARRRARSSSSSRSATASRRSSTRSASPRPARRSCRRTACAGPPAQPGCQNAEWFDIRLVDPETDREVAGRRGRRARRAAGAPVDVQQRLLQHAGEDRRGLAEPVVPHRRRAAPRRGRLVLLRRPLQGRAASARREHQLLRGRAGPPRAPRRRRVRGHRRRRPTRRPARTRSSPSSSSPSRSTAEDVLAWCDGQDPGVRHPALPAHRRRAARRRRRRRSASRSCATTASPPTPTTAPSTADEPSEGTADGLHDRTRSTRTSARRSARSARRSRTSTGSSTTRTTSSRGTSTTRSPRAAGSA